MFKNQRHEELLDILKKEGFAEVRSLSERLYASQPTIRRDLNLLEKQGYVHRSHGGAILADDRNHTPVSFRRGTKPKEKMRICRLAATLAEPGNVIFTDASTTASYLAELLPDDRDLTVVTNGYPICRALSERGIRTFSTGGRLLTESMAFVGSIAEETVSSFNADLLFFSASSLDESGTVSDYSEEETALRRLMLRRSRQSVFLCDSGKFNSSSAFRSFSLSEIDYTVTDYPLPPQTIDSCGLVLLREMDGACLYGKR